MAGGKRVAGRLNAWICFADECGQPLHPAKATTLAPRGLTPVVKVTAKGGVRVSVAGLVCYRPGHRSRLIYRTATYRARKNDRKGFREPDFADLLNAAYHRLKAPIVLVWDRLPAHKSARMLQLITARPWLRVYQLPGYPPNSTPPRRSGQR